MGHCAAIWPVMTVVITFSYDVLQFPFTICTCIYHFVFSVCIIAVFISADLSSCLSYLTDIANKKHSKDISESGNSINKFSKAHKFKLLLPSAAPATDYIKSNDGRIVNARIF